MDFHQYLQRAKVYRLSDEGKWDDKGTGHVSVEFLERSEAVGLVVIDEEDNATLLVHRISADDIYRRTEDTIISWTDPEVATDLALSFQETMGCCYIWDQICNVQRSIHYPNVNALDVGPRSANEVLEHLGTSQANDDTFPDAVSSEVLELPAVELSSLPQIVKILTEVTVSFLDRDRISLLIIKDPNFLRKIVGLFTICEDLENIEGLHMLYKIAKAIISLNDGRIFDILFCEEFIMDIIGILEYDPEAASRQNHRSFLKQHVIFKEAIPIEDSAILAKIHQTYRIEYIKDVILPNVLDNPTFASINSMILANNVAVVSALQEDTSFLKKLFAELRSPDLSGQAKKDLVHLLQEFCSLSKSLQLSHRMQLFSSLVREGLFDIVTDVLGSVDESVRLSGMDILIVVLNYDPSILRKFLVQQPGHTLVSLLVTGMLSPGQGGVQAQLLEVLRMLLDCESGERQQPDKSPFLDVFYGKYMDQIMEALTSPFLFKGHSNQCNNVGGAHEHIERSGYISPEILGNICELLCFCVQHHSYTIKYYVMRNRVMEKVLQLTTRREKYVVVAAVRFLRTCIGRKDEFYYRYIVKNDILEPVIKAFLANGSRYNLLNSAVLELFDFILKENVKTLIVYIIEKYYDKLENIQYVNTFNKIKNKYDQAPEGAISREQDSGAVSSKDKGTTARDRLDSYPDPRRRKDERALDKDEEEYFNEDSDDEEDTASAQATVSTGKLAQAVIVNGGPLSGSFGLVDYEDEDEDPPTVRQDNFNERQLEVHSDGFILSSGMKDSVWLDKEEDKVIQNIKRKSILSADFKEKEADLVKKRKASVGEACRNEQDKEKLSAEILIDRDKIESSVRLESSVSSDEGFPSMREVCDTSGGKDFSVNSSSVGNENMRDVTAKSSSTVSSAEPRMADIAVAGDASTDSASKGGERSGSITNGTGLLKVHGVGGIKSSLPQELIKGGSPSSGAYSIR